MKKKWVDTTLPDNNIIIVLSFLKKCIDNFVL